MLLLKQRLLWFLVPVSCQGRRGVVGRVGLFGWRCCVAGARLRATRRVPCQVGKEALNKLDARVAVIMLGNLANGANERKRAVVSKIDGCCPWQGMPCLHGFPRFFASALRPGSRAMSSRSLMRRRGPG